MANCLSKQVGRRKFDKFTVQPIRIDTKVANWQIKAGQDFAKGAHQYISDSKVQNTSLLEGSGPPGNFTWRLNLVAIFTEICKLSH